MTKRDGMTKAQLRALRDIDRALDRWSIGRHRNYFVESRFPVAAAALARAGLLDRQEQSEWDYPDRRRYFAVYSITPAGRAALANAEKQS